MNKGRRAAVLSCRIVTGALLLSACRPVPQANLHAQAAATQLQPTTPSALATAATGTRIMATSTTGATAVLGSASESTPVEITALGNVFVRRGPDVAFNSISVLYKGESARPDARDVLSHWVRIPLPAHPSAYGWISIMTDFTEIDGDVEALPEFEHTEWPQLGFLRNCTYHVMMVRPGEIMIPSIVNFPDNDVRLDPGKYSVIDIDAEKDPEVMQVEIREGSSIDIIMDGYGEKKKCADSD